MIERAGYEQFSRTSRKQDGQTLSDVSTTTKFHSVLRSIGAVLLGLVATIVLSVGTDVVMHATSIYPPWGEPMRDSQFAIATTYRSIYAIAGSYIAARFAPGQPMQHAIVLGVIGFVIALVGTVLTWNAGPAFARKRASLR